MLPALSAFRIGLNLRIDRNGVCYPSKVVWRSANQIGVMFLDF